MLVYKTKKFYIIKLKILLKTKIIKMDEYFSNLVKCFYDVDDNLQILRGFFIVLPISLTMGIFLYICSILNISLYIPVQIGEISGLAKLDCNISIKDKLRCFLQIISNIILLIIYYHIMCYITLSMYNNAIVKFYNLP